MEKEFLITTDNSYHEAMIAIYDLMNKGETNLSTDQIEQLKIMALAAERYEDEVLQLKPVR